MAPETPGSIHEGGELGYALTHAYGAAFDNPDLVVACVIGDGEAETGPLATAWHSNKFLNPASDGAVLPILHLNGYKIASPTVLARISKEELESLFRGYGYTPYFVEGHEPMAMHETMAATFDTACAETKRSCGRAALESPNGRAGGDRLRTRRGGTAKEGRRQCEALARASVPMVKGSRRALERFSRLDKSNRPSSFRQRRALLPELRNVPQGPAPHGRQSAGQRRAVAA